MSDVTSALFGVVVGFVLSEFSNLYKKYKEENNCIEAIYDEARFNYNRTKDKIDILNKAILALIDREFLPTKCAKYSTQEFENMYHVAINRLSTVEKDNFRHLNGFYLTIDAILDGFEDSFKADIDNASIRNNSLESVYDAAIIQLEDIKQSLLNSLILSSRLLDKKPMQIFV